MTIRWIGNQVWLHVLQHSVPPVRLLSEEELTLVSLLIRLYCCKQSQRAARYTCGLCTSTVQLRMKCCLARREALTRLE
jgi:hypothetical protein